MHANDQTASLAREIRDLLLSTAASHKARLTEQELADRFGVSRTPVRDALKELEKEGIVERRQKKGVSLRAPSVREIAEVYDLRAVLEGFAGRLAVESATKDDLKQLSAYASQFTRYRKRGDVLKSDEANIAFHNKIVELAGNSLLTSMMEHFSILRRAFGLTHSLPVDRADQETPYPHEAIVERIGAGDANGCEKLLQAHIRRAKRLIIGKALGLKLDDRDRT